jgi:hypothetical protein
MALTRTIPIKNRVFSVDSLNALLKELSTHYRKSKEAYSLNWYRLNISEDDTTTVSLDTPPKTFDSLLSTPIRYISLRIDSSSPDRRIDFTLYHGSDSIHNSIRLHSGDDDWVNLAHGKVSKLLDSTEPQSDFLKKHGVWLTLPLALTIGWPLKSLFMQILIWVGQAKQVPWSLSILMQHLTFSGILGFLPATILLSYAANAYPSVEIQTGPPRKWQEAARRKRLRVVFSLAVIAPSADLLYDVYQKIF